MKIRQCINRAAAGRVAILIITSLIIMCLGCAGGYRLHQAGGAETLYHIDDNGSKRIVYVVGKDGTLRIHDENDPIVRRYYADHKIEAGVQVSFSLSPPQSDAGDQPSMAAKLIRIGRVKAAKKRHKKDPIFVTVHDAEVASMMPQFTRGVEQTQKRFKKLVTDELSQDRILKLTPQSGDVDVFFKSYFKETSALNVETHKLVTVTAFCFEAHVRSNYLPEDSRIIKELGHWMDSREVIKRTAQRVNKVVKEVIGPSIPRDRKKFLPLHSQGV